jgi:hypothetical protein
MFSEIVNSCDKPKYNCLQHGEKSMHHKIERRLSADFTIQGALQHNYYQKYRTENSDMNHKQQQTASTLSKKNI